MERIIEHAKHVIRSRFSLNAGQMLENGSIAGSSLGGESYSESPAMFCYS